MPWQALTVKIYVLLLLCDLVKLDASADVDARVMFSFV